MKEWTEELLLADGYKLQNAEITNVSLNFRDHGVLSLDLTLNGGGWGVVYGGYVLGHGYLGAKEFKGSASGMEAIMRIMDVVGVEDLVDLKGKHVRVATKGWGSSVKIIGHFIQRQRKNAVLCHCITCIFAIRFGNKAHSRTCIGMKPSA